MGDTRNDMMLILSPSTSQDHLCRQLWTGQCYSGPASVAIPGRPVEQSVLVGASLDQLLWVTLEWFAQSESLQFIIPEAVPAGFTGCSEHSNK